MTGKQRLFLGIMLWIITAMVAQSIDDNILRAICLLVSFISLMGFVTSDN